MSNNVDQRVVEMKFDNAQFERNVKTSMSTIDKLKNSLNLLESTKCFENIDKESKKLDFAPIGDALQNVGSKFSALSVIAFGALQEIGRQAVETGKRVVRSLTIDPIKQGFDEYELKMGSVQTIMAGSGESLDVVMDKLNELNRYADRTIYSFSDMTTNIGKFTNAGVNLKDSVAAIQGVANVAAVSGANAAEASRAMYNFAQALSSGYVKLIDWKSIENANMATVEFKNQLLEAAVAAGTVEKTADGMYQVLGTNAQGATMKEAISATKNFNDSLSYQWMTTEVLTSTLAKYSDETTDIGKKAFAAAQDVKTFSQLMDTLKEAVGSGWAETFENIFGNFEEAKKLWTNVNNVVSGIIDRQAKARNELLSTWKNAGGRDDLLAAFGNIFSQISGLAKAVRKEVSEMFPAVTANKLWTLTKKFRDFTETLDLVHKKFFAIRSKEGNNIVKTFKGLFAAVALVKDIVVTLIKPIKELFSGFGNTSSNILDLTANLGDFLVNTRKAVLESGALEEITKRLGGSFRAIGGFIGNVVSAIKDFVNGFKMVGGSAVGNVLTFLHNLVDSVIHLLFQFASALTGKDLSKIEEKVTNFSEKIHEAFMKMWNVLKPVFDGIKEMFAGSFSSIKDFFESFKGVDLKPAEDFKDKTEKVFSPFKDFFEGIKNLFKGIGNLFKGLAPVFSGIISGVGKILGVIGNALSAIVHDFDITKLVNLLSGVLKVGIGVKIYGFMNGLKKAAQSAPKIMESIKGMFDGLSKLFGSFKEVSEAKALEKKSKALRNIAISIGILAAALFVLSSIESSKLNNSITVITVMLGELVLAMEVLAKMDKKTNLKKIGTTLIGMAAAILVLSLAIKSLSGLSPDQIKTGLLAITVLLAEMVIAAKVLSKNSKEMLKGSKNALAFAIAIRILVSSVKALGKMNPEQMVQGMIGVTILLAEMVIAAKLIGNDKTAKNMMKGATNAVIFALALRVLVSSVKALGNMSPEQLVNGMIGITILLAEMVAAIKIIGNNRDSKRMLKGAMNAVIFAAALRVLVSSVKALGSMSLDQMVQGLAGLTAMLVAMTMTTKAMEGSGKGALSMLAVSGAMLILAASLKILGTLSWNAIAKGLVVIAGAFILMGIAAVVLGPVVGTILALAGAMALIGLSAALFGAGMLMISAAFTALGGSILLVVEVIIQAIIRLIEAIPEMISALAVSLGEAATDIITCIVEVARALLPALKEIIPEAVDVVLELILTTLQSLAENIQPIVEALLEIVVGVIRGLAGGLPEILTATLELLDAMLTAIMGAFDGLDAAQLAEAMAALVIFEGMMALLAAITVTALVAVLPLPIIGRRLSNFIDAAEPFLQRIQEVDPASLHGAKALAEMILILTANGILDGLTSWLTGGSSMVDFGEQLAEFAPYIKKYADGIAGVDANAVEASANAALALAAMAANLPNSGGVVSWFTGDNTLSDFADELIKFGPKLKEYADSVSGLNVGVVAKSVAAAQIISSFADNLPNSGGIVSWFTGDNTLSAFADELVVFGPKLAAYANSVSGLNPAVVVESMIAANAISEFAANLPNAGGVASWFTGDNTLAKFGESMAEFGGYLMEYSIAISGINLSAFLSIIPGLTALVSIAQDINAVDSSSVGSFAESFVELATDGVSGFANAFIDSTAEISDAIETMLFTGLETVSNRKGDFKKSGSECVTQFVKGVKTKTGTIKSAFTTGLTSSVQTIRSYYTQFYNAGAYLVSGYVQGINNNRNKAVEAARVMVQNTINTVNATQKSKSPAKEGIKAGSYLGEGYVIGLKTWVTKAASTGKDLVNETINATNNIIGHIADYISSGMDTQPRIRPVLDLTGVTDGFGQLNALFSRNQAIGLSARMLENTLNTSDSDKTSAATVGNSYNFIQNNYSPKALSASEIYRQTKNQFSRVKGRLPVR